MVNLKVLNSANQNNWFISQYIITNLCLFLILPISLKIIASSMSIMLKSALSNIQLQAVNRALNCTPVASLKIWRASKGLPANKNAEGILTDGPDYTYLDGRPTPLLHKQKQRMLKQQAYASRIVELCSELDYAKTRHQDMLKAAEEERENIIRNRLKPKGAALKKH